MANNVIGNAVIEIRADANKLKSDMNNVKTDITKSAIELGKTFGLAFGAYQVVNFMKQAVSLGAELEVLRGNFKGTAQDIELFKRATANTVSEANLIKLSNQATDLGLSLEQQALFFSLAEDAADKYGGGVEEGMNKVIMATEGNDRALKALGIQEKVFQEIVKDLTKEFANQGLEIDAETIKQIRIEAIIRATGLTIEDVKNKTQDSKDKLESWGVAWDNIQRTVGSLVLPVLFDFGKLLENTWGWLTKIGSLPKDILSRFNIDISDEGLGLSKGVSKKTNNAPAEGSMEALQQKVLEENAKKIIVHWTATGKTVEEVKKHIETLKLVQDTLIVGSKELLSNQKDIAKLTDLVATKEKSKIVKKDILESFNQQKTDLVDINKLLENRNLSEGQRNFLLEKQKELSRAIYKYEHPESNIEFRTKGLQNVYSKIGIQTDSGEKKIKPTLDYIDKELENAQRGAEQFSQTLSGGFGNAIMAGENLGDTLINITAQLAGAVLQAGFFAAIMSIVTGGTSSFGGFFVKALGFGAMTDNGTNISVPNINSNAVSSSFSMQNNFNDSNIVGEIKNLNNKINALANRPLVSNFYMNRKLVGRSVSLQQYQDTSSNVKVY
jgi:hypothetical protein